MRNLTAVMAGGAIAAGLFWAARGRNRSGWLMQHPDPDPDLLVFELGGHVGRTEIRRMADAVLAAFARTDAIDMLVLLPRFTGLTPAAALDLKGLKAGMLSLGKVRRYGVVAPPRWAGAMITVGDWIIPVEARSFARLDVPAARDWVTAGR